MMRYDKYEKDGPIHHGWYETEPWYQSLIDFALVGIEGESVVDLGCGDGLFVKLASEAGYFAAGLDDNDAGIKYAKQLAPKAMIRKADINNLIIEEDDFVTDTVVCINAIEHFEKPEKVAEVFLKSRAKKLIVITNFPNPKGVGRYHFKEYKPFELVRILGLAQHKHKITELPLDHYALEVWK